MDWTNSGYSLAINVGSRNNIIDTIVVRDPVGGSDQQLAESYNAGVVYGICDKHPAVSGQYHCFDSLYMWNEL